MSRIVAQRLVSAASRLLGTHLFAIRQERRDESPKLLRSARISAHQRKIDEPRFADFVGSDSLKAVAQGLTD